MSDRKKMVRDIIKKKKDFARKKIDTAKATGACPGCGEVHPPHQLGYKVEGGSGNFQAEQITSEDVAKFKERYGNGSRFAITKEKNADEAKLELIGDQKQLFDLFSSALAGMREVSKGAPVDMVQAVGDAMIASLYLNGYKPSDPRKIAEDLMK